MVKWLFLWMPLNMGSNYHCSLLYKGSWPTIGMLLGSTTQLIALLGMIQRQGRHFGVHNWHKKLEVRCFWFSYQYGAYGSMRGRQVEEEDLVKKGFWQQWRLAHIVLQILKSVITFDYPSNVPFVSFKRFKKRCTSSSNLWNKAH